MKFSSGRFEFESIKCVQKNEITVLISFFAMKKANILAAINHNLNSQQNAIKFGVIQLVDRICCA